MKLEVVADDWMREQMPDHGIAGWLLRQAGPHRGRLTEPQGIRADPRRPCCPEDLAYDGVDEIPSSCAGATARLHKTADPAVDR